MFASGRKILTGSVSCLKNLEFSKNINYCELNSIESIIKINRKIDRSNRLRIKSQNSTFHLKFSNLTLYLY